MPEVAQYNIGHRKAGPGENLTHLCVYAVFCAALSGGAENIVELAVKETSGI